MKPPVSETPNAQSNTVDRKAALKKMITSGLALSFVGFRSHEAHAQFRELEIGRALNFILFIEFLEESFYLQTTTSNGLLPDPYQDIFTRIRTQHQGRVVLVKNLLGSFEVDPLPQQQFTFRIAPQNNPFINFDQFLNFAQIIEDLASGVYKQQVQHICENNPSNELVRTMMQLLTTESRHAYYVRQLRTQRGLDNIKGWIDESNLGTLSSAFANIYRHEDTTIQEEVDVPSITDAPRQAVREAWDEPISRGLANEILGLFTNPI